KAHNVFKHLDDRGSPKRHSILRTSPSTHAAVQPELWERFSYYGMNGILAIYLYFSVTNGGLGLDKGTAVGIVGAYGGAAFLATILGAWVADRLAGAEKALF